MPTEQEINEAADLFLAQMNEQMVALKAGIDLRPRPSAKIEKDWRTWLMAMYPNTFSIGFAPHHERFWQHAWSIQSGKRPRPFIFVLARGGGKSSSAEALGPMLGALGKRTYGLYISATQEQANKHVADVESKLTVKTFRKYYPEMASPKLTEMKHAKGWRQNRLWTKAGWVMDALGLDTAARGAKAEDQRPSFIILDDIDSAHASPIVVEKNKDTLKKGILPTGSDDLAVFAVQNLIDKDSIFAQLVDGRAGFLTDAIIEGPHPAVIDFEYERRGRSTVVLSGEPTWEGQDLGKVQEQVDTWGIDAFLTEAQHDVDVRPEGAVFPHYDERYSVITWSEFARVYGDMARDGLGQPRIPRHWLKGRAQDFGTTTGHPCGTVWVARPGEMDKYADSVFVYRELVLPEYPYPETPTEDIEAGEIAKRIVALEAPWQERMSIALFSHEQTAALNTYHKQPPPFNLRWTKWRPDRRAGIAPLQSYFAVIDEDQINEFRPQLSGRSRLMLVVADGQGELQWDEIKHEYYAQPAEDAAGLRRLRDEIVEYQYPKNAQGNEAELPVKDFDDVLDPLKALADVFFPGQAKASEEEKTEAMIPERLRMESIERLEGQERTVAEYCRQTAYAAAANKRKQHLQPRGRTSIRAMRDDMRNRHDSINKWV